MIRSMASAAAVVLAALLSGCATPLPLNNVTYEGKVSASSDKAARVVVVSGATLGSPGTTTMIPAGKIFVPVTSGPAPALQFTAEDQRAFGQSLRSELVRLKLFASAVDESAPPSDISVNILFPQTYHNIHWQEYTLDVVMTVSGGKEPFVRQYRVISSEEDSTWAKWNTNAYEGKLKAVKLLLRKLIPDIEAYVAKLPSGVS